MRARRSIARTPTTPPSTTATRGRSRVHIRLPKATPTPSSRRRSCRCATVPAVRGRTPAAAVTATTQIAPPPTTVPSTTTTTVAPPARPVECVPHGHETVATDKADYSPESTVQLSGSGYASNCVVRVEVKRPDGSVVHGDGSFRPGVDEVTTTAGGVFAYSYRLDGVIGTYSVRVLGAGDAVLASTTSADSPCSAIGAVLNGTTWRALGGLPGDGEYDHRARSRPLPAHPERRCDPREPGPHVRSDRPRCQRNCDRCRRRGDPETRRRPVGSARPSTSTRRRARSR